MAHEGWRWVRAGENRGVCGWRFEIVGLDIGKPGWCMRSDSRSMFLGPFLCLLGRMLPHDLFFLVCWVSG